MNQEERLIDYLYGEMNAAEKAAFERELAQNPELQKELVELQDSRQFLVDLPDVPPPATILPLKTKQLSWRRWAIPVSIAAAFLLLLKIVDFQVVATENGIALSFGEPNEVTTKSSENKPQYVTVGEMQQLLERQDKAYQKTALLRDSLWQRNMNQQAQTMRQYLNQQLVTYQQQQQKELATFTNDLRQETFPEMANLVQNLLDQHQKETQLMLGEAWANWQAARDADLENIKTEFANVYQNQNETDALLLNVISTGDE
ncbi:MAG: hypothetical protein AAGJ18_11670 [Bacteroidota bacterium]